MRITVLVVLCLLLLASSVAAQHCPFDGWSMVVVHLTDSDGKPVSGSDAANLTLREIDNPNPDACTYAPGLVTIPFAKPLDLFKLYTYYSASEIRKTFCDGCTYLSKGYYAVRLNQPEESCMLKQGNDFDFQARKYEITYSKGVIQQKIRVPKDRIYGLCKNYGSWARIIPVDLKLPNKTN